MTEKDRTGRDLERHVADLYRRLGATRVAHNHNLQGNQIDVYVEVEAQPGLLHRVAIEVKDWETAVGVDIVNKFKSIVALLRADRQIDGGIIVSNSGFSGQARNAAQDSDVQLLEVADLEVRIRNAEATGTVDSHVRAMPHRSTLHCAQPFPLHANFTGRVSERSMLTRWLTEDDHPILAITGMGGVGKSSLAWVWVNRDVVGSVIPDVPVAPPEIREQLTVPEKQRPDKVIWWSFYEGEGTFGGFLEAAIEWCSEGAIRTTDYLSVSGQGKTVVDHDGMQKALLQMLQQDRVLLIWDGVERLLGEYRVVRAKGGQNGARGGRGPNALDIVDKGKKIDRFWSAVAAQPSSRLLLLSRLPPLPLEGLAGVRGEELEGLPEEEAADYLVARGISGLRRRLIQEASKYEFHPQSLSNLAAHLLEDFEHQGDISAAPNYDETDTLQARHRHILELAYKRRASRRKNLLSRMAAMRGGISKELVLFLANDLHIPQEELSKDLGELVRHGLLRRLSADLYDFHPIVRRYCYKKLRNKRAIHLKLSEFFPGSPAVDDHRVGTISDLTPLIEQYYHTARAGRYDDAAKIYARRLNDLMFFRFGAYVACIELLRWLFPDGEDRPPRLKRGRDQSWTLDSLANCYALSGWPHQAVAALRLASAIDEKSGDKINLAVDLGNLGGRQIELGKLKEAQENITRRIRLCREFGRESKEAKHKEAKHKEAIGHVDLGLLLGYEGRFEDAEKELDRAIKSFRQLGQFQSEGVGWAYKAVCSMLMGRGGPALANAEHALRLAREVSQRKFPFERDLVRAEWLLGVAKVLAAAEAQNAEGLLKQAERHLAGALRRCRKINNVEQEAAILLAWAKWHHVMANYEQAGDEAQEALEIADSCGYRLQQADINNFLARLALGIGRRGRAKQHAEIAGERAACDESPHCYEPALREAEELLQWSRIPIGVTSSVAGGNSPCSLDAVLYAAKENLDLVQVYLNREIIEDASLREEVRRAAGEKGVRLVCHAPGLLKAPEALRPEMLNAAKDLLQENEARIVFHVDEQQPLAAVLSVIEELLEAGFVPCVENYHVLRTPEDARLNYRLCRKLFDQAKTRGLNVWAAVNIPRLFHTGLGLSKEESYQLTLKVFQALARMKTPILLYLVDSKDANMDREDWCPLGKGLIPYARLLRRILSAEPHLSGIIFRYEDKISPLISRRSLYL